MSLDWKCGPLAEGLGCFRRAQFFEAHEHWESIWIKLENPEKNFIQGLIQLTVALHHQQTGNHAGAISLSRRALRRLEQYPPRFGGINVEALCVETHHWLQKMESADCVSPAPAPRICPIDASNETAGRL